MRATMNKTMSTSTMRGQYTRTKYIVFKNGNEVVNTNERRLVHEVRGRVADNAQVARIVEAGDPTGRIPGYTSLTRNSKSQYHQPEKTRS